MHKSNNAWQVEYCLKSGHIIVYTGLLRFVANDDELAAVMGHEISHVSFFFGKNNF
jgi:Zn-dependent protease with chaperone function